MSLSHALLTALAEKSGSGLDLARRFDKSIGHFWQASHQQIYRELARLEETGLIHAKAQPGARGGKRVYQLLPAGQDELRNWVPQADQIAPTRDAMMVRLRAEATLGPTGLAPALHRRLAGHRTTLAEYRAIQARDFPKPPPSRQQALQGLVLEAGIRHEEGWIELLKDALKLLESDP